MNASDESSDQRNRRLIKYDGGHLFEAESWRVAGTLDSDSLQWRFIGPRNYTLVVRPVQIKSNNQLLSVPSRINPAYGAAMGLILLVHERMSVLGGPEAYVDPRVIDDQLAAKIGTKARDKRKNLEAELWEQARKEDLEAWREEYDQHVQDGLEEIHATELADATPEKRQEQFEHFKQLKGKENAFRAFIFRSLRSRHQKAHPEIWAAAHAEDKAKKEEYGKLAAAEGERLRAEREQFYREVSLYDINEFIGRHAGKKPVTVKNPEKGFFTKVERDAVIARLEESKLLNKVHRFILKELKPAEPASANIVHQADCRQLVLFIGEQLGKDIRLSVLRDINKAMAGWLKTWSRDVARDRHLTTKAAELFLLDRIRFMAECEGRSFSHWYPIEDIQAGCDVHDKADDAPYEIRVVAEMQFPPQVAKRVAEEARAVVATAAPEQKMGDFPHPLATPKYEPGLVLDENDKKTIIYDNKQYKCQPYHWEVIAFCHRDAKLLRAGKTQQPPELLKVLPDGKLQVSIKKLIEKVAPEKASLPQYLKHGTFFKEMDNGLKKKLFENTGRQYFLIWLPC